MALIDLDELASSMPVRAETIVVGAGAIGLALAVQLARGGKPVLLLEAGPYQLSDSSHSLFRVARSVGPNQHTGLHHGRFRMLGGTSNFWGGQIARFEPHIFEPRAWLSDDLEWPIAETDLQPFYEEALNLLGLSGVIRSDGEVLNRIHKTPPRLSPGLELFFTRWLPQPNLATFFDHDLQTSRKLTCCVNAHATALTMSDNRVSGVEIANSSGQRRKIAADRVILANGTIEIARLLMLPLSDGQPAPWSENPWLGRGFIDHLRLVVGRLEVSDRRRFSDLFENVVIDGYKYQPKLRLSAQIQADRRMVDAAAEMSFNSAHTAHLANAKIFLRGLLRGQLDKNWKSYPASFLGLLRFGLPMVSRYLRSNRIHGGRGSIDVSIVSEQIPAKSSQLRLTSDRDRMGIPIAELDWQIDGRELATISAFSRELAQWLDATGFARLDLLPEVAGGRPEMIVHIGDHYHQMGMARMGSSREDGVVDSDCKVFGTPNLFVAGAAVFPSSGHSNPTFTGIALGLRLAKAISDGRLA